jgi:hypothetical protein
MLIVPALGARAAAHWQTSAVASRSSLCKPIEGPTAIASLNAIYGRSLDSLPTGVTVAVGFQTAFRVGGNGTCQCVTGARFNSPVKLTRSLLDLGGPSFTASGGSTCKGPQAQADSEGPHCQCLWRCRWGSASGSPRAPGAAASASGQYT